MLSFSPLPILSAEPGPKGTLIILLREEIRPKKQRNPAQIVSTERVDFPKAYHIDYIMANDIRFWEVMKL